MGKQNKNNDDAKTSAASSATDADDDATTDTFGLRHNDAPSAGGAQHDASSVDVSAITNVTSTTLPDSGDVLKGDIAFSSNGGAASVTVSAVSGASTEGPAEVGGGDTMGSSKAVVASASSSGGKGLQSVEEESASIANSVGVSEDDLQKAGVNSSIRGADVSGLVRLSQVFPFVCFAFSTVLSSTIC